MAEFCVRCHERLNAGADWILHPDRPWRYDLGWGLCEGCGQICEDLVLDIDAGPIQMLRQYIKYKKRGQSSL